jgi:hypothetical protein
VLLWRRYIPLGVRACARDQETCNLRRLERKRRKFVSAELDKQAKLWTNIIMGSSSTLPHSWCNESDARGVQREERSRLMKNEKPREQKNISTNQMIRDSRVPNMMQALHGSFSDDLSHLHLDLRHWSQATTRSQTQLSDQGKLKSNHDAPLLLLLRTALSNALDDEPSGNISTPEPDAEGKSPSSSPSSHSSVRVSAVASSIEDKPK